MQRAYKAFAEGDLQTVLSVMTDDVDWKFGGPKLAFTEPRSGRTEVEQAFKSMLEQIDFEVF